MRKAVLGSLSDTWRSLAWVSSSALAGLPRLLGRRRHSSSTDARINSPDPTKSSLGHDPGRSALRANGQAVSPAIRLEPQLLDRPPEALGEVAGDQATDLDDTLCEFVTPGIDDTIRISCPLVPPREGAPAPRVDERQQVLAQQLSPALQGWLRAYADVGHRGLYLWKWCLLGVELTTLPTVSPELRMHARDTKVLSIMLNILLDDVADEGRNGTLLGELLRITRGDTPELEPLSPRERAHAELAQSLRNEYWSRVQTYPRFEAYRELLEYDLTQLFNTIHYSYLLNRQLGLLNIVEHDLYSPHNMMMMSFATLDLMCSPEFPVCSLGKLREAIWHAQWMGRIGNLLSTWRREIAAGDFTSGVFARAVANGDLSVEQLQSGNRQEIEAAIQRGRHHEFYRRRWEHHRQRLRRRLAEIDYPGLELLIEGHDRFFRMHMESRGLI
jgi:hypothetical protein